MKRIYLLIDIKKSSLSLDAPDKISTTIVVETL